MNNVDYDLSEFEAPPSYVKIDWKRPERSGREIVSAGRYGTMSDQRADPGDLSPFKPSYLFEGEDSIVSHVEEIILNFLEASETESKELWRYLRSEPYFKNKGLRMTQGQYAAIEQALQNLKQDGLRVYKSSNPFNAGWFVEV